MVLQHQHAVDLQTTLLSPFFSREPVKNIAIVTYKIAYRKSYVLHLSKYGQFHWTRYIDGAPTRLRMWRHVQFKTNAFLVPFVQLVYSAFYSFADGQRRGRVTFSPVAGPFFYVTVVRSAPAASDFSKICGSIVFEPPPAKVSAVDLFDVSPKV